MDISQLDEFELEEESRYVNNGQGAKYKGRCKLWSAVYLRVIKILARQAL